MFNTICQHPLSTASVITIAAAKLVKTTRWYSHRLCDLKELATIRNTMASSSADCVRLNRRIFRIRAMLGAVRGVSKVSIVIAGGAAMVAEHYFFGNTASDKGG